MEANTGDTQGTMGKLVLTIECTGDEFLLSLGDGPRLLVYDSRRKLIARVKAAIEQAFPDGE